MKPSNFARRQTLYHRIMNSNVAGGLDYSNVSWFHTIKPFGHIPVMFPAPGPCNAWRRFHITAGHTLINYLAFHKPNSDVFFLGLEMLDQIFEGSEVYSS